MTRTLRHITGDTLAGLRQWRLRHPAASAEEIDSILDARLADMRSRLIRELTATPGARGRTGTDGDEPTLSPLCWAPLSSRTLRLHRGHAACAA